MFNPITVVWHSNDESTKPKKCTIRAEQGSWIEVSPDFEFAVTIQSLEPKHDKRQNKQDPLTTFEAICADKKASGADPTTLFFTAAIALMSSTDDREATATILHISSGKMWNVQIQEKAETLAKSSWANIQFTRESVYLVAGTKGCEVKWADLMSHDNKTFFPYPLSLPPLEQRRQNAWSHGHYCADFHARSGMEGWEYENFAIVSIRVEDRYAKPTNKIVVCDTSHIPSDWKQQEMYHEKRKSLAVVLAVIEHKDVVKSEQFIVMGGQVWIMTQSRQECRVSQIFPC